MLINKMSDDAGNGNPPPKDPPPIKNPTRTPVQDPTEQAK